MLDYIKVEDKHGVEHTLVICPVCGYFYDKDREENLHQDFHKKTIGNKTIPGETR